MHMTITIPDADRHYSLFAEGALLGVTRERGCARITLDAAHPVTLYYKVAGCRRLYVCSPEPCGDLYPQGSFAECARPLYVMAELTGRRYDRYKRAMKIIAAETGGRCYCWPRMFYLSLVQLCVCGKNSLRSLGQLMTEYDHVA